MKLGLCEIARRIEARKKRAEREKELKKEKAREMNKWLEIWAN